MGAAQQQQSFVDYDDARLILAYREGAGDPAFSELIRRYQIPVFRLLLGMLGEPDSAEVVCERVFFDANRKLDELGEGEFRGWVLGLARKAALEEREKRPPEESVAPSAPVSVGPPRLRVKQEVQAVLGQMAPEQRLALVLADAEHASTEEIAEVLGGDASQTATLVEEARQTFARLMAHRGQLDAEAAGDAELEEADSALGSLVAGRYRLKKLLGKGGMGAVYTASDEKTHNLVAVKLLHPETADSPAHIQRFKREGQALLRVQHDNFVSVFDTGTEGSVAYLVMELVDGSSLDQVIGQEQSFAVRRALHVTAHVLRGLVHAHEVGVVHRDIKPANIMLTRQREDTDFAKILDLGIAKLVAADDHTLITREGQVLGTPAYMAPEQILGQDVDARADLYSVAVMLYEMLTSRLPFDAANGTALMAMQLACEPTPLADAAPDLSDDEPLERLLGWGLAKDPVARCRSAGHFLQLVERVQDGENIDAPPTPRAGAHVTTMAAIQRGAPTNSAPTAAAATPAPPRSVLLVVVALIMTLIGAGLAYVMTR